MAASTCSDASDATGSTGSPRLVLPAFTGTTVPVPGWGWNEVAQRYIHEGRFVSPSQVRGALDAFIQGTGERLAGITSEMQAGRMALADWQLSIAQELKAAHIASAVAANGGWDTMTQADWGQVGGLLKEEYSYLGRFAGQIADGSVRIEGDGLQSRVGLYAEAPRHTYEAARLDNEREAGYDVEWNELGPADHCDECLALTDMGEVEVGVIPLPGERECGNRCGCTVRRRRSNDGVVVDEEA